MLGVKLLLWFVVYVLLSKSVIILQTATLCLCICSQCLLPVKLYFLGKIACDLREKQTLKRNFSQEKILWRSVSNFSLHIETRIVLGPSKIIVCCNAVSQDVLQFSNVGGQTLRLNLLHVHEVWLYGYDIQDSLQRDNWLWLFKIYLHRVRYGMNAVFNSIEITTLILYLTQCRYIYTWCAMGSEATNLCVGTPEILKFGGHHIFRVFYT